jgi:hypothetical protein
VIFALSDKSRRMRSVVGMDCDAIGGGRIAEFQHKCTAKCLKSAIKLLFLLVYYTQSTNNEQNDK